MKKWVRCIHKTVPSVYFLLRAVGKQSAKARCNWSSSIWSLSVPVILDCLWWLHQALLPSLTTLQLRDCGAVPCPESSPSHTQKTLSLDSASPACQQRAPLGWDKFQKHKSTLKPCPTSLLQLWEQWLSDDAFWWCLWLRLVKQHFTLNASALLRECVSGGKD